MLIEALVNEHTVPGYPSLIVGLMVIGGVQLMMIGVMGEYIGKILSEIKARPVYFVAEHSVKAADEESARTAADSGSGEWSWRRSGASGCSPTTTASRRRSTPRSAISRRAAG